MKRLVLASGNAGKVAELQDLLGDSGFALHAQSEFGVADVEETASTFIENALLKARHAARISGLPSLGDDSGLCVDALHGAPGLYSARYGGVHGDATRNIARLLDEMRDVPEQARGADFHCVLVLLREADDPRPLIAEGRWRGRILHAPRGGRGFGYDPIFVPDEYQETFGEMDPELKHRISHRARAFAKLKAALFD